jgi:beta-N-acetylhexosaminidase
MAGMTTALKVPAMSPETKPIPDISDLSLDERIGQVLCFGWQGETPEESRTVNAHAREIVEEMRVGSVVLLGRNVGETPEQTREMVQSLQAIARIPLFIAVDQEGGSVNRFRTPFHEFPGNMALGAIPHGQGNHPLTRAPEQYALRQAEAQARELRAVGINWNFAPVVDVNNNPDNPIIGVRSYGEEPKLVAKFGAAAVRGYQGMGLLACAKHFPGHGDTAVDSHLALPTLPGDRARLDAVELVPFRAVIEAGVGAIMTTHILFPELDGERPATMSRAILTGLLRGDLDYDGIVITDCLEMDAIGKTIGTPRGAVEALKAGADVALVCHTLEMQRVTVAAIKEAVASGELSEGCVNEAAARVLTAKRKFLSDPPSVEEAPWLDPGHDELEREIARASMTVVRNRGALPLRLGQGKLLLISMHPAVERFGEYVRRHAQDVDVYSLGPEAEGQPLEIEDHPYMGAVVLTCPREPWSPAPINQDRQAILVRTLQTMFRDDLIFIVAAIREPYDLRRFPNVANYLCTFGYRNCSLEALADALFGEFKASGRLPVTIPGLSA